MKFLKYFVLLLGITIWAFGLSPYLMRKAGDWNLIRDGYQYGDLYRLCLLSEFKDPKVVCTGYEPPKRTARDKKIHLYVIGDSFTEAGRIQKDHFDVDHYQYVHWSDLLHIKLDTSAANVLLLESVERHLRQKMVSPLNVLIPDTATFAAPVKQPLMTQFDEAIDGGYTDARLDAFLMQNELMLAVKSAKADFTKFVFNRVDQSVTRVNGGRDLVYYMDTDTPNVTSSFSRVRATEIDSIVMNLNLSQDIADSLGFDHVILSVIPNKVSVIDPDYGPYNRLIERVYNHPNLRIPRIDVLTDFRNMGRGAYLKGDSHWTCEGQRLWLDKTNTLMQKLIAESN